MSGITAVILAAGLGVRMGPRGQLTPKGLLTLGGARLTEQSVASLRHWGAARIVLVTGHLAEQYEAVFGDSDVELIHNPIYATTGSLRTLVTALEHVEGPIAILESDLIYAPQALDLIDGTRNRFVVSGPTGAGDEVYVWTDPATDGAPHMRLISKNRAAQADTPFGEMVGISGLTAEALPLMREAAQAVLARDPAEHYEAGLVELLKAMPMECMLIPDLPWAEVDDEQMLARAEAEVAPKVAAARQARL